MNTNTIASQFINKKYFSVAQKKAMWAWLFLAIPIIFFIVVRFYPTIDSFYISLTKWNIVQDKEFIGLENYIRLFSDPVFWVVLSNTFEYLILGMPISLVLSFTIAYNLDKFKFGHTFIRACYFIPYLTTAVAMAWVWRWFYQSAPIGLFNNILIELGLEQMMFLRSTEQALPSVLAPAIWAGLGFQILIFMAGLRSVPASYLEAAKIDGAGRWQVLKEITLPHLWPTIVFLVVISTIGFLRIFDQVYNMTLDGQGGPINSSRPLVLHIYQSAFADFEMGFAAAQTVVLFAILSIITFIQFKLMRRK
jgi:multiple sugar transport system permease protein